MAQSGGTMNLSDLYNEVSNDPTGKGYASFLPDGPGHVVDLLNAETEQMIKQRYITARTVLAECGLLGASILASLETIAPQVPIVKWAVAFLGKDSGIDIGNPVTQGMIQSLVSQAGFPQDQATALANMAMRPASRAEVLGLGRVTEVDLYMSGVINGSN